VKTNFKKSNSDEQKNYNEYHEVKNESSELTKEEFEDFIIKSGAKGSFMIYRTENKDEELGIDEL